MKHELDKEDSSEFDEEEMSDKEDGVKANNKPEDEEEDYLIKALRFSRERKERNAPPDIKLSEIVRNNQNPQEEICGGERLEGIVWLKASLPLRFSSLFFSCD